MLMTSVQREDGEALQDRMLPGVSRTFALTIPELPPSLRLAVTNAYLLCRTADTIEDEVSLTVDQKQHFENQFVAVVEGRASAEEFSAALVPLLSDHTLETERDLVRRTADVVAVTHGLVKRQRIPIERCVRIMCAGMPPFQRTTTLTGLANVAELDRYCYCVAGVVGEMLTDLFCAYDPDIDGRRDALAPFAVSFGQGLQMTNIIKDVWSDRQRGVCWFPRDVFSRAGVDLATLAPGREVPGFAAGVDELIGLAHAHLRNALRYTLTIPRWETGIRRFCLWALGLAVLTLRKIHGNRRFLSGQTVKVSRSTVRATVLLSSWSVQHDQILTALFRAAAAGLPLATIASPSPVPEPSDAPRRPAPVALPTPSPALRSSRDEDVRSISRYQS